jgi:stage III sporulation protein AG
MNVNIQEKLNEWLKNEKLRRGVVAAGIIAAALMVFTNLVAPNSGEGRETDFAVSEYCDKTEGDLERMLANIRGAGKTKVLLTMENSVEYVYLKDSTTKTKEIQPHIRGVLVVCEGGDDPVAVERITTAVTKALDISTAKVCITKLSE